MTGLPDISGSMSKSFLESVANNFPEFAASLENLSGMQIADVGEPATKDELNGLESELGLALPESYKQLLRCSRRFLISSPYLSFGFEHPYIHDFEPLEKLLPQMRERVHERAFQWSPPSNGMLCFADFFWKADGDQVLFDISRPSASGEYPIMYYDHETDPPLVQQIAENLRSFLIRLPEYEQ